MYPFKQMTSLPPQAVNNIKESSNWKNAELSEKCLDESKLTFGVTVTSANIYESISKSRGWQTVAWVVGQI